MTLNQVKTFVVGVIRGAFTNKGVLDKFSEDENGNLLYNGLAVGSGTSSATTDEQVNEAIPTAVTEINAEEQSS